jgi:hypothetical protein
MEFSEKYALEKTSCGKKLCGNCRDVMRKPVTKCGKCKFWVEIDEPDSGECRINPPVYDRVLVGYTAAWPVTSPEDSCSQGKPYMGNKSLGIKTQVELRKEKDPNVIVGDPPKEGFLASKLPIYKV